MTTTNTDSVAIIDDLEMMEKIKIAMDAGGRNLDRILQAIAPGLKSVQMKCGECGEICVLRSGETLHVVNVRHFNCFFFHLWFVFCFFFVFFAETEMCGMNIYFEGGHSKIN
jgi:hypothetical protein